MYIISIFPTVQQSLGSSDISFINSISRREHPIIVSIYRSSQQKKEREQSATNLVKVVVFRPTKHTVSVTDLRRSCPTHDSMSDEIHVEESAQ